MWRKERTDNAPAWLRESNDNTNEERESLLMRKSAAAVMGANSTAVEDYYGNDNEADSDNDNDYDNDDDDDDDDDGGDYGSMMEEGNSSKHLLSLDNAPEPDTSWLNEPTHDPPTDSPPPTPQNDTQNTTTTTTANSNNKLTWEKEEENNYQKSKTSKLNKKSNSFKNKKSNSFKHKKSRAKNDNDSSDKPPKKPFCLSLFSILTLLAVLSNLLFLVCQITPLFYISSSSNDNNNNSLETIILQYILRIYLSILTLFFILGECEVPLKFIQQSQSINNWISRGFLYTFLSMVGMQQSNDALPSSSSQNEEEEDIPWMTETLVLTVMISEWIMFAVGVVYMLLGICCMKRLKDRLKSLYQEEKEAYHDQ